MEWSPALTFAVSVTECAVPPPPLLLALPLLLPSNGTDLHSSQRARSPSLTQTLYIRLVCNANCLRRGTGGGGGGRGPGRPEAALKGLYRLSSV